MRVHDLFSGLGGFSEAFVERGHQVTRYDIEGKFAEVPHTTIQDVLELTAEDLADADVVLASPPCTHFSCAAGWKYWPNGFPTPEVQESVELVKHTMQVIDEADPEYWILENPVGQLRRFLGPPAITTYWGAWGAPYLKPTDLWGILPNMIWPSPPMMEPLRESTHGKHLGVQAANWDVETYNRSKFSYLSPRSSELRSLIPYEFSLALCCAIEENPGKQYRLHEFENGEGAEAEE